MKYGLVKLVIIFIIKRVDTQLTFTYSMSTIETVKKGCEMLSNLTIQTPEPRN